MTRGRRSRAGFTLTEVLIGSTLAAAVLASVLSSFLFVGRNLARLASYQALETEARKALAYIQRDLALAQRVKSGTVPAASTVTLVLPAGEVTYTYDSVGKRLRRQASFGQNTDFFLLQNNSCECSTFSFSYFTTTDGAPTGQVTPATIVPYSVKQVQVRFTLESPSVWSADQRTRYETTSSRVLLRNRGAPDGS